MKAPKKDVVNHDDDLLVEVTSQYGSLGVWRINASTAGIKLDEIGRDVDTHFGRTAFRETHTLPLPEKKGKKGKKGKK